MKCAHKTRAQPILILDCVICERKAIFFGVKVLSIIVECICVLPLTGEEVVKVLSKRRKEQIGGAAAQERHTARKKRFGRPPERVKRESVRRAVS